jgi:DNA (cytosine-5)-methyltransferase 1
MSHTCDSCQRSFSTERGLTLHLSRSSCSKEQKHNKPEEEKKPQEHNKPEEEKKPQEHNKPLRIKRPIAKKESDEKKDVQSERLGISLFSGAGGDTLGLERSGVKVIAFSECKSSAIATHQKMFPHSELIRHPSNESTDIKQIPDNVFLAYKGRVEVVFAGFPCQGFSHAGKKRVEDPRNELVYEFARVVNLVRPAYMIGENVPGLLSRQGKDPVTKQERPVIDIIRDIFQQIGYHITYRVWKATDHGVPQERKRLIIMGVPMDKGWPKWEEEKIGKVPTLPTLRGILETHLEGAVEWKNPPHVSPHYWIVTNDEKATGKPHPNLLRLLSGIRALSKKERSDESNQQGTVVEEGSLISFGVRKSAYHGQIVDPDMPCKTIICTYGHCPRLFVGLYHPGTHTYWVRCLSVKELGQIQGFPADYDWQGNEKDKITQIGNAVPPPLAEAVMESIAHLSFTDSPSFPVMKKEKQTRKQRKGKDVDAEADEQEEEEEEEDE